MMTTRVANQLEEEINSLLPTRQAAARLTAPKARFRWFWSKPKKTCEHQTASLSMLEKKKRRRDWGRLFDYVTDFISFFVFYALSWWSLEASINSRGNAIVMKHREAMPILGNMWPSYAD
nr:uncharacterized protein LOC106687928 [Halyomorpha halys]